MKSRDFPGITFRVMDQFQDFGQCVELQKETWGRDWTDIMDRKPAHWSHQLAVTHAHRNSGLGRAL